MLNSFRSCRLFSLESRGEEFEELGFDFLGISDDDEDVLEFFRPAKYE